MRLRSPLRACLRPLRLERKRSLILLIAIAMLTLAPLLARSTKADEQANLDVALSLAEMLQAARTVISSNQDLINDPSRGDKGLTGDVVLAATIEEYKKIAGVDPLTIDPASQHGRLLRAEMDSIKEVMDENQDLINEEGLGFKGFIPAIFGRLITERLQQKMATELRIKVTAPPPLVRNRKARPNPWEEKVIEEKFLAPSWPRGQIYYQTENAGKEFRVLVPEYYSASCLSCHGGTKGEIDITGYPKEGASEGDLGGVISITLLRPEK